MKLTELKYLLAVADTGSINRAAKELYVAQPNVSKTIKRLEQEYNITLFERTRQGVMPTREGQRFIQQARKIMNEVHALDSEFEYKEKVIPDLKIAIPRASYISQAFVNYVRQLPQVDELQMGIMECSSMDALNHMIKQGYHMAVIRFDQTQEEYFRSVLKTHDFVGTEIMTFRYRLLVADDNPLVDTEIHDFAQLKGQTELLHGDVFLPNGEYRDMEDRPENHHAKKRIHVYERGSQFALLRNVPNTYMWVSPMPSEILDRHRLVQKKCDCQTMEYKDVLVYPKNHYLLQSEQSFLEALTAEASLVQSK